MENQQFWQFSDQLRLQSTNFANLSIDDSIWSARRPEANLSINDSIWSSKRPEERRNFDSRVDGGKVLPKQKASDFNSFNEGWKNNSGILQKNNNGISNKEVSSKIFSKKSHSNNVNINHLKEASETNGKKNYNSTKNSNNSVDKRFKTLPPSESLPRNEAIGGYIFVCNNDTMEENLRRQLFGLPPRYRDSVRAITPGLPLFLYNYSTHQLHGIFEAASFGGTNIDPTAWEDKKCPGESRFPAQVGVVTRKICGPLEEDAFRPILHHYDGPKFRLELSVPEALALLDIFAESGEQWSVDSSAAIFTGKHGGIY
ncbi:B2 protein-like [Aristolochia californica]|uniref:B2 protein-like n=1 Tax=Aristolochia californica TaxID=171875 RepID=UPI0035DD49DA